MEEIWKDIKGYEGIYQVSNQGRVKSLDRYITQVYHGNLVTRRYPGKIFNLKPEIKTGYVPAVLTKDSIPKYHLVHRLVAQAFIPNPDNLPQVNHKDENTSNNRVDNLEWCTNSYNVNYGTRNEKVSKALSGRRHSAEHNRRNSESHRGKRPWNYGVQTKPILCLDEDILFRGSKDVAEWIGGGITRSAVEYASTHRACCKGHILIYAENVPKDRLRYMNYCYSNSRGYKHLATEYVDSID